jgi:hypothetical protein
MQHQALIGTTIAGFLGEQGVHLNAKFFGWIAKIISVLCILQFYAKKKRLFIFIHSNLTNFRFSHEYFNIIRFILQGGWNQVS